MNEHILITATPSPVTEALTHCLTDAGYPVSTVSDRETILRLIQSHAVSLALVDITAPNRNGFRLIRRMRRVDDLPILVYSSEEMENEGILSLNLGADAFLTTPLNTREVLAYVRALHRRCYHLGRNNAKREAGTVMRAGDLVLDTEAYCLLKRGTPVALTSTELKLLTAFMGSPGRIFSREQLYQMVNGASPDRDGNSIGVHISNLRSKLEDDPGKPVYIKTVRGMGYKLEPESAD